jgi:hypothetical protein
MPAYRCWRRRPGPGPPPKSRTGSGAGPSGPPAAPKLDRRAPPESSDPPLPMHRSDSAWSYRGCDFLTLRGVALTFSVCPAAVAAGLASRLRLRPFRLATWTLASSSDRTPGRLPSRSYHHSWPCTHPRGPRSPSWPLIGAHLRLWTPPLDLPSLGLSAPTTLPACKIHFPEPGATPARSRCAARLLVAGFHARFGPPSPFSTTLTVCASARPVTCFSHSRPWGWAPSSLLAVLSHPSEDEPFRTQGVGGLHSGGSRTIPRARDSRREPTAPPLWTRTTSPAPAPRYVRLGLRRPPAPNSPEGASKTIAE